MLFLYPPTRLPAQPTHLPTYLPTTIHPTTHPPTHLLSQAFQLLDEDDLEIDDSYSFADDEQGEEEEEEEEEEEGDGCTTRRGRRWVSRLLPCGE